MNLCCFGWFVNCLRNEQSFWPFSIRPHNISTNEETVEYSNTFESKTIEYKFLLNFRSYYLLQSSKLVVNRYDLTFMFMQSVIQ